MKRIVICGSMSASREMVAAAEELKSSGHTVVLPHGAIDYANGTKSAETAVESTENKRRDDLIRGYYEEIKQSDAVLIMNVPKRGIDGYIGGNTFLEFAFAHVLGKPVFLMYPYDETSPYASEMGAMDAIVVDGDVSRISI